MADYQHKCALCGKTHGLFSIELTAEDGGAFNKYVCGSCWEVVAEIAHRAMYSKISKLETRLDEFDKVLRRNLPE